MMESGRLKKWVVMCTSAGGVLVSISRQGGIRNEMG